jgi:hypothetical protein
MLTGYRRSCNSLLLLMLGRMMTRWSSVVTTAVISTTPSREGDSMAQQGGCQVNSWTLLDLSSRGVARVRRFYKRMQCQGLLKLHGLARPLCTTLQHQQEVAITTLGLGHCRNTLHREGRVQRMNGCSGTGNTQPWYTPHCWALCKYTQAPLAGQLQYSCRAPAAGDSSSIAGNVVGIITVIVTGVTQARTAGLSTP